MAKERRRAAQSGEQPRPVDGAPPRRKGARRMAEIPAPVLAALNEGREETITLVEWLAIDSRRLLGAILPQVGLEREREAILCAAAPLLSEGIARRVRGMGGVLLDALRRLGRPREAVFEALAAHPSDMVRSWASYVPAADPALGLEDRLALARRFAADSSMSVREGAWDSFRPFVARELERGIELLGPWVLDPDANIRRCAIEATRPRGVWTEHIEALKKDPSPGIRLLEPLRADPSRYVQRAVANWLNDASKTRADWTRAVCARWRRESPAAETLWVIDRALRTLAKAPSAKGGKSDLQHKHRKTARKKANTKGS